MHEQYLYSNKTGWNAYFRHWPYYFVMPFFIPNSFTTLASLTFSLFQFHHHHMVLPSSAYWAENSHNFKAYILQLAIITEHIHQLYLLNGLNSELVLFAIWGSLEERFHLFCTFRCFVSLASLWWGGYFIFILFAPRKGISCFSRTFSNFSQFQLIIIY